MHFKAFGIALVAAVALASAAVAAQGPPPPPKAVNGHPVAVVARGVPTPTAFAFAGKQVFVAGFGDEEHPAKNPGGVYVLKGGKAVRLAGSPPHVFGLAYKAGTLYLSAPSLRPGGKILAWSGWNGTRFAKSRVVATGPKGFTSFNGIAAGPDGKIYAGVAVGQTKALDSHKGTSPYANDLVTVDPGSGAIKVFATGIRQPWQIVFVPGRSGPLVSDLGQENLGKKRPPDYLLEIKQGADYGFPSCPAQPKSCSKYPKPFAQFPAHSSPTGLGALGGKLYVALFGGTGKGPEVVSMPTAGGKFTPFLTGFVAPVVGLGVHGGRVYVGDLTGSIYSVKP